MKPSVINKNCIVSCQHINIHLHVTTRKPLASGLHVKHTMLPCCAEHKADLQVIFDLLEVLTSSQVHLFQMRSKNVRPPQTTEPMSFHSMLWRKVHWSPGLQQCPMVHSHHAGVLCSSLPYTTWRWFRVSLYCLRVKVSLNLNQTPVAAPISNLMRLLLPFSLLWCKVLLNFLLVWFS